MGGRMGGWVPTFTYLGTHNTHKHTYTHTCTCTHMCADIVQYTYGDFCLITIEHCPNPFSPTWVWKCKTRIILFDRVMYHHPFKYTSIVLIVVILTIIIVLKKVVFGAPLKQWDNLIVISKVSNGNQFNVV